VESELILAFTENISPQFVYAYLPVNRVGLPFALNAELELVSSRQEVTAVVGQVCEEN